MKSQQAAEREEQQRIKNLVLNYDLREGDDLDGDFHLPSRAQGTNIHTYGAGAEKNANANYTRPDKSSNNRSGQRARKLQLSDVDWYDRPGGNPNVSTLKRPGKCSSFGPGRSPSSPLKQRPAQAVNSGLGFSVTPPRQLMQSSKPLPRTNGRGRLTRREILQEHASRRAEIAATEK